MLLPQSLTSRALAWNKGTIEQCGKRQWAGGQPWHSVQHLTGGWSKAVRVGLQHRPRNGGWWDICMPELNGACVMSGLFWVADRTLSITRGSSTLVDCFRWLKRLMWMLSVTSSGCSNSYYRSKRGSQEADKHRRFPKRQLFISSVNVSVDILNMYGLSVSVIVSTVKFAAIRNMQHLVGLSK